MILLTRRCKPLLPLSEAVFVLLSTVSAVVVDAAGAHSNNSG